MEEKKSKHSIQRKVYRKTRSAVRRWRSQPLATPSPKRLKIFTNVQSASVAGITRVMSSFAEHVNASPDTRVELVCISTAPDNAQHEGAGWQKETNKEKHLTSLLYEGVIPPFAGVLQSAKGIEDVSRAYAVLIDAYRATLKEEKPDVVLVNGTYVIAWALMIAARGLRYPVVHYYHGSLIKETEHWQNEKHKRIMRAIETSFDRADLKYVFPSTLVKHYVERNVFRHSVRKAQALVLPNPIPKEFFETPIPKDKKGVAFVGRWTRVKNTTFLDRFAYLNHMSKNPLDLYVVTDERGRGKASKVLHDRVRFAGPYHSALEMAKFYASMQAVICPSHFETYGNVAQEAVAAGTPALVSRNMGVAEVFRKVGLDKLIVSFANVREVFALVQEGGLPAVTNSAREALREVAGESTVHQKLLEFIKS